MREDCDRFGDICCCINHCQLLAQLAVCSTECALKASRVDWAREYAYCARTRASMHTVQGHEPVLPMRMGVVVKAPERTMMRCNVVTDGAVGDTTPLSTGLPVHSRPPKVWTVQKIDLGRS